MKEEDPSIPIEVQMQAILEKIDHQEWTTQSLFEALKGKGYPILIVLLSLPFCQPIQIPGFSLPFGVTIIFLGLRMAFGKHIWWPKWILKQKISPQLLKRVIKKSLWFLNLLKRLLHKRWTLICTDSILHRFHGCFIALMGFYLALPLPIPLSNLLAAYSLLFIGLGLIEDDGIFVSIGYVIGIAAIMALILVITLFHNWIAS